MDRRKPTLAPEEGVWAVRGLRAKHTRRCSCSDSVSFLFTHVSSDSSKVPKERRWQVKDDGSAQDPLPPTTPGCEVLWCVTVITVFVLCKIQGPSGCSRKKCCWGASRTPKVSQSLECCQLPVIIDDVVLATSARGMAPPHPVELTESPYWNRSYGVFAGTHALLERLKPLR